MGKGLLAVGLVLLSLAAGYGVHETMQSHYPQGAPPSVRLPGNSDGVRIASSVGVVVLFRAVVIGLVWLVRSQPSSERGLVVIAWLGWTLFGVTVALTCSLWQLMYLWETQRIRTFVDWAVTRALVAGLIWSAVVIVMLATWQHRRLGLKWFATMRQRWHF